MARKKFKVKEAQSIFWYFTIIVKELNNKTDIEKQLPNYIYIVPLQNNKYKDDHENSE